MLYYLEGLPTCLSGKKSTCQGLVSGLGRSPGGGNGNPLQYSCLGNPMDRDVWRATVHEVTKKLDTTSDNIYYRNVLQMSRDEKKMVPRDTLKEVP